jgi:hypothetical protein
MSDVKSHVIFLDIIATHLSLRRKYLHPVQGLSSQGVQNITQD